MAATVVSSRPMSPRRRAVSLPAVAARAGPDVLRGCLCVLMVLNISRIHQRYGWLGALRPGLVLTLVALAAAFIRPQALAPSTWMKRWPVKVVLALTAVALGSIVFGISQGAAYLFFSDGYWKALVGCVLLMAAIRHARDLKLFVWAYVVGTGVLVFMALFVFQMAAEGNGITRLGSLDTWDANDVCVLVLIGLPFCLLLMRTSKLVGKLTAGTVAIGIGAVIAHSGSRGGFLGLLSVLVGYLLSMKGSARIRGVGIATAVAIGLAANAPPGYWNQMSTITSAKQDYNWDALQGRRQLAIRGMGYMIRYPIFGLGVGNFGRAEGTISDFAGQHGTRWSATHNTYVQAGAELGVLGFLLFDGMVVACIVVPWRLRKRIPAAWDTGDQAEQFLYQMGIYLPVASIGFAVPAYFVSFAYNDPIYILLAMTAGLLACVDARLKGMGHRRPPAGGRSGIGRPAAPRLALSAASDRFARKSQVRPNPSESGAK